MLQSLTLFSYLLRSSIVVSFAPAGLTPESFAAQTPSDASRLRLVAFLAGASLPSSSRVTFACVRLPLEPSLRSFLAPQPALWPSSRATVVPVLPSVVPGAFFTVTTLLVSFTPAPFAEQVFTLPFCEHSWQTLVFFATVTPQFSLPFPTLSFLPREPPTLFSFVLLNLAFFSLIPPPCELLLAIEPLEASLLDLLRLVSLCQVLLGFAFAVTRLQLIEQVFVQSQPAAFQALQRPAFLSLSFHRSPL